VSSIFIFNLARTLKAITRHHVKVGQTTLDEMTTIIKRIEVLTKGLTRRNRDRLRPFDDPANLQALIELPQRLMKEAGSGKLGPRTALLAPSQPTTKRALAVSTSPSPRCRREEFFPAA